MQEAQQDQQAIHPWVQEGLQKIRAGVGFMDTGIDLQQFSDNVQAAEELGYDSIWIPDHPVLQPDCWAQLAVLSAITHRIRLGTFVHCVFYRHPLALARVAGDVDRWSHGRLVLGLGIGDFAYEFAQLGIPFLSTRERQETLEETVQILQGIWKEAPFSFTGKHFQVQQAQIPFGPVQQPHIPLMIAGGGERVTLRQVAHYADASNFGPHMATGNAYTLDDVVRKNEAINAYCASFGRPTTAVLRTHTLATLLLGQTQAEAKAKLASVPPMMRESFVTSTIAGTVDTAIAFYQDLARSGMNYFIIGIAPGDIETLHMFKKQVLSAVTVSHT